MTLPFRTCCPALFLLLGCFGPSSAASGQTRPTTAALSDKPFTFASTPGILPKTAYPQSYAIQITPSLSTLTFSGSERIVVKALQPTATLVLNEHDVTVESAALVQGSGSVPARVAVDDSAQTLTLKFPHSLAPGLHTIEIVYSGHIIEGAQGLYYVKYHNPDGSSDTLLATQMESTDARRLFPCWDEPVYRASYQLTATVPADFMAVSNMPITSERPASGGLKTVAFAPTPKMASYLVAFAAGHFDTVSRTIDGIPVRVIATRGKGQEAQYALDIESQVLPYYNSYFGQRYPLPKLDLIGIPGGFDGAMENWGAIVYNERALLYDPKTVPQDAKIEIYETVAHETAHQWFGDLVTMSWWDDIWLNESFATWMEQKAADRFNPDWHIYASEKTDTYRAMNADERVSAQPIRHHVVDAGEIEQAFDPLITYTKGGAVLRMIESYIGPDRFREGIRRYMTAHQYSSTTAYDLWGALSAASGKPIDRLAGSWITQSGFPLVEASTSCVHGRQQLSLTQRRLLLDAQPGSSALWQIPIALVDPKLGDSSRRTLLMTERTMTVPNAAPCGDPVVVNSGAVGYYRVGYSGALLAANMAATPGLAVVDRVAIIGDQWALVEAQRESPADFLDLLQQVRNDRAMPVWHIVNGAFETLNDLEKGRPGQAALHSYEIRYAEPLFNDLGWSAKPGDSQDVRRLRKTVIEILADADDPTVIAQARAALGGYLADPGSLPADQRDTVLIIAGANADRQTWDKIHTLAKATPDFELKAVLYEALASVKDPALAEEALQIAASDERPANYASYLVQIVADRHPDLAWSFFIAHEAMLMKNLDTFGRLNFAPRLLTSFNDDRAITRLDAYVRSHPDPDAAAPMARAKSRLDTAAQMRRSTLPVIDRWVAAQGATAASRRQGDGGAG